MLLNTRFPLSSLLVIDQLIYVYKMCGIGRTFLDVIDYVSVVAFCGISLLLQTYCISGYFRVELIFAIFASDYKTRK